MYRKERVFLTIAQHEYELVFGMPEWLKFEDEIGMIEDFEDIVNRKGRLRIIPKMVAILSVEQPVSAEQILRDMEPEDVREAVFRLRRAIQVGLRMTVEKGDENEVVDEVLEEIEKKETGAS